MHQSDREKMYLFIYLFICGEEIMTAGVSSHNFGKHEQTFSSYVFPHC